MSKDWPTTQEHLIDHLLRIVQGVSRTDPDENGTVEWGFGFGEDALTTYQPSSPEDQKEWNEQGRIWKKDAKLHLFCSSLGIAARDHMGVPKPLAKLRSELFSKDRHLVVDALKESFPGEIEWGYAYEMLSKLKDMVDRGKEAVQEIHMLPKVPRWVDKYMSQAASCFRYGFDLACISLCRSALEEALKDRLSKDFGYEAIKQWNEDQEKYYDADLFTLINRASERYKILRFPIQAHDIRLAGNKCAHGKLKGRQVRQVALDALAGSRWIIRDFYSGDSKL